MDRDTLVARQIEDGRDLLRRLVEGGFDVAAAAWVKNPDEQRWYLYIVSKAVTEEGLAVAYRKAYSGLQPTGSLGLSMSEIKLVPPTDPLAVDLLTMQRHSLGAYPTRSYRTLLGQLPVEEVYVYPRADRNAQGNGAVVGGQGGLEELWTARLADVTLEKYSITFEKQPFKVTRSVPPGFDQKSAPVIDFTTNYALRERRLVMTKIQVAMQHDGGFYGVILKEWEEASDYSLIPCQ